MSFCPLKLPYKRFPPLTHLQTTHFLSESLVSDIIITIVVIFPYYFEKLEIALNCLFFLNKNGYAGTSTFHSSGMDVGPAEASDP